MGVGPTYDGLIRDRYQAVKWLGRGGQGDVVRALDQQHDRWVALKIRPAPDATRRQELLGEARILLALRPHPNLPLVREDFFWDDRYVLVMDWVDGIDLGQLLTDTGDPGLPVNGVVDWMAQVASALDHLHAQGIVHGDVKPANIVLTPDGRAVLVDFGISRVARDPGAEPEGQSGSPGYAAPEQAAGDPLTRATDVYGLAATTVALLTGAPPTGGRPDWTSVPGAVVVERALRRGLTIEPDRRPRSASELVERLQAHLTLALPTGVVTFLLTDIEGSSLLWEHDPEAMADVLANHDNLIADAVEEHGGRLLKTRGEGDATFSVFAHASAAVAAAVSAQQQLVQRIGLGVRMAVHSGEAQVRDGDYYGRAINRVARLRELAIGGQVLLSSASADLVADALPSDVTLVDLGSHELRGLNRTEGVWGIGHPALRPPQVATRPRARVAARIAVASGVDPTLADPASGSREATDLVDLLRDHLAPVLLGEGRIVLVPGDGADVEAAADELAAAAGRAGAAVVRSRAAAAPGYSGWLPMLAQEGYALPGASTDADADIPVGASVLPPDEALADAIVDPPDEPRLLVLAGAEQADAGTLLVLEALADRVASTNTLIVVTYAGSRLRPEHPLMATLGTLARKPAVHRIELGDGDERGGRRKLVGFELEPSPDGPETDETAPSIASTSTSTSTSAALLPIALLQQRGQFVGRGRELAIMRRAWHNTSEGGHQLLVVSGEPGIGKTSLAAALAAEAHADGSIVLFGRCDDDAAVPFQPIAEVLRDLARSGVASSAHWSPELTRLVPELPQPAVDTFTPSDPEIGRYRFFEAFGALLDDLAERQQVVLVLDDLHWADRPTLSLIRHLLRRRSVTPLLVVGTYRDTEVDRVHPLSDILADLRRERLVQRLHLDGLSVEETVGMLEARADRRLDDEEMAFAAGLHRTAEGNPFFIDELLRHLDETGALGEGGGRWRLDSVSWPDLGVPDGIRDVISQRLRRLSPDAGTLLASAAIVGREAPIELLRQVMDLDEDRLIAAVEEIVASGLMVEGAGSNPGLMYSHTLVRETVYRGLSLLRRQRAHLQVAEALEAFYGSDPATLADHAGALAAHYRLAGSGADPGAVLTWSERAGEAAARIFAYEEATAHWETAVALLRQRSGAAAELHLARLLERVGTLAWLSGDADDDGVAQQEEALAIFERHGVADRAARVHTRLASHFATLGIRQVLDIHQSLAHIERAGPMLAPNERDDGGYYHVARGAALLGALRLDEAITSAVRAIEISDFLGDRVLWANATLVLALARWEQGHLHEAAVRLEEAWRVAREALDPVLSLVCAWNRGNQLLQVDDPEPAIEWYERELRNDSLARASGARASLERNLTLALYQLGRDDELRVLLGRTGPRADLFVDNHWDDALAVQLAQHQERQELGDLWGVVWHAPVLAAHARLAGREDEGVQVVASTLPLAEERGAVVSETLLRIQDGRLRTDLGDLDGARATLVRARELLGAAQGWGATPGRLQAAEGVLAAREGDPERGIAAVAEALECFHHMGQRYLAADAHVIAAQILRGAGDDGGADDHLGAALATYEELGSPTSFADRAHRLGG